jgi:predicted Fe-Mo cluster-binding NifX family protein
MKLIAACATDDGRAFSPGHFGSARTYALYELNEDTCKFLQNLPNTGKNCEEEHADPQNAERVRTLLSDKQVQVVVAKRFGPNIGSINQFFVPVIV